MSDNYEDQIDNLLEQAGRLDHGPTEIALLEEAVRIADSHQRTDLGFDLRKRLMQAATFGGSPEKALVAFTWCIAQCDKNPDEFDSFELLWEYKWVVSSLKHFPQISQKQINDAMEDMTRRYEEGGLSLRPIHKLKSLHAIFRGDLDEARKWQRQWRSTDSGFGNDCPACELHDQVEFLTFVGKDERAIEMAHPILAGRSKCAEIPHLTYSHLLNSYMKLGRVEEALEAHKKGYRMIANNRDFLAQIGEHLIFLAQTGNLDRALPLIERHLEWALETNTLSRRFLFNKGVIFLLQELEKSGTKTLSIRLPKSFPEYREDQKYDVKTLLNWFEKDARELAAKFDKRNGNDYFAKQIDELPELMKWAKEYRIG